MYFWPDKGVSPEVIPQTGAKVTRKMIAAYIVGTAGKISALEVWSVKPEVFTADSSHQVNTSPLFEGARVNCIEVVEDWSDRNENPKIPRAAGVE
jgi:hypothetical protein